MAKQLINEVKRFQKIAGIITEDESRTKMGLYLMFSAKDGKLVATMELPNHSENDSVKKQIEAKGEYKLFYTDDPSNYLKFKGDGYKKYIGKTAEELGIMKESTVEEARKKISISDIDFNDDGNRDDIFSLPATDVDIEALENGEAELEWEDDNGDFGVYKLPTGEYMYAFPDGDYYIKTPKGVVIDFSYDDY